MGLKRRSIPMLSSIHDPEVSLGFHQLHEGAQLLARHSSSVYLEKLNEAGTVINLLEVVVPIFREHVSYVFS
jgi:hypothetical protein